MGQQWTDVTSPLSHPPLAQEFLSKLQERTVAYINVDISVFCMWLGQLGVGWERKGLGLNRPPCSFHSQCYPPGTGDTPCTKCDLLCHQRGARGYGGLYSTGWAGLDPLDHS